MTILFHLDVTPCVGVWIETRYSLYREGERGSHPAWVCGLKPPVSIVNDYSEVTPCVGVWIETALSSPKAIWILSHPAWVCGLKPLQND